MKFYKTKDYSSQWFFYINDLCELSQLGKIVYLANKVFTVVFAEALAFWCFGAQIGNSLGSDSW